MMRKALILFASASACVCACSFAFAAPAAASPGAAYGLQDDAWLTYGPGSVDARVSTLKSLGAKIVRYTLRWDQVARARPAQPRDPADPAYEWAPFADVLEQLHAQGIPAIVTLYGSPRWSNGGKAPNALPSSGFGDFAYAAAQRFPWVRKWTVWNEPNGRTFSSPVSPKLYVQRLLNPAYVLLHRANRANLVAGGVTSPRSTPSGMAPLAFMQGMSVAHARLDAYAQNPYPVARGETPTSTTCTDCTVLTMAKLPQIRADVTRYFGSHTALWLTEYGYQTNPPDRLLGVSSLQQADYLAAASLRVWQQAGVTVLIWFLVRDEPNVGGWQSGLVTVTGKQKPAYREFQLPLAEIARAGRGTLLWGQVRPGSGARPYTLQVFSRGGWRTFGGTHHTDRTGTLQLTVSLPPSARVRLWSPVAGTAGPTLVLR